MKYSFIPYLKKKLYFIIFINEPRLILMLDNKLIFTAVFIKK